jgi:hypothetical protein
VMHHTSYVRCSLAIANTLMPKGYCPNFRAMSRSGRPRLHAVPAYGGEPMAGDPGSVVHRRRLGTLLRHYRLTAGITAKPVAERLFEAPSKIICIEKGQRLTTANDMVVLRLIHGLAGEVTRQELTQPADGSESRRSGEWRVGQFVQPVRVRRFPGPAADTRLR